MNNITFNERPGKRHGKPGTLKRTKFKPKANAFAIGEVTGEAKKAR